MMNFKTLAVVFAACFNLMTLGASAETTIFELRITNDTNSDLTFELRPGKSKHSRLTYNKKIVTKKTIKAGVSDTIGIRPTARKCAPYCGACNPAIGKVYAYYRDDSGKLVRSNYFQAKYEFFEYCGVAGDKPITTYTSNWSFDHGKGKGDGNFEHDQKAKTKGYTSKNPAQGLTFDAKKVSGHATITFREK